jgi:hypothetical protein
MPACELPSPALSDALARALDRRQRHLRLSRVRGTENEKPGEEPGQARSHADAMLENAAELQPLRSLRTFSIRKSMTLVMSSNEPPAICAVVWYLPPTTTVGTL